MACVQRGFKVVSDTREEENNAPCGVLAEAAERARVVDAIGEPLRISDAKRGSRDDAGTE